MNDLNEIILELIFVCEEGVLGKKVDSHEEVSNGYLKYDSKEHFHWILRSLLLSEDTLQSEFDR